MHVHTCWASIQHVRPAGRWHRRLHCSLVIFGHLFGHRCSGKLQIQHKMDGRVCAQGRCACVVCVCMCICVLCACMCVRVCVRFMCRIAYCVVAHAYIYVRLRNLAVFVAAFVMLLCIGRLWVHVCMHMHACTRVCIHTHTYTITRKQRLLTLQFVLQDSLQLDCK
jgi:hypothetical protein